MVSAGKCRRPGKVLIFEDVQIKHDRDKRSDAEDDQTTDEADADQGLDFANPIDDKWPNEVKLLFYLERPEMIDIEMPDIKGAAVPKGQVSYVEK